MQRQGTLPWMLKREACHPERCEENFYYFSWEFWEEIGHSTIFFPLEKLTTALFVSVFCFIYLFEIGSLYVALTGLEITTAGWTARIDHLPVPPESL